MKILAKVATSKINSDSDFFFEKWEKFSTQAGGNEWKDEKTRNECFSWFRCKKGVGVGSRFWPDYSMLNKFKWSIFNMIAFAEQFKLDNSGLYLLLF